MSTVKRHLLLSFRVIITSMMTELKGYLRRMAFLPHPPQVVPLRREAYSTIIPSAMTDWGILSLLLGEGGLRGSTEKVG